MSWVSMSIGAILLIAGGLAPTPTDLGVLVWGPFVLGLVFLGVGAPSLVFHERQRRGFGEL